MCKGIFSTIACETRGKAFISREGLSCSRQGWVLSSLPTLPPYPAFILYLIFEELSSERCKCVFRGRAKGFFTPRCLILCAFPAHLPLHVCADAARRYLSCSRVRRAGTVIEGKGSPGLLRLMGVLSYSLLLINTCHKSFDCLLQALECYNPLQPFIPLPRISVLIFSKSIC